MLHGNNWAKNYDGIPCDTWYNNGGGSSVDVNSNNSNGDDGVEIECWKYNVGNNNVDFDYDNIAGYDGVNVGDGNILVAMMVLTLMVTIMVAMMVLPLMVTIMKTMAMLRMMAVTRMVNSNDDIPTYYNHQFGKDEDTLEYLKIMLCDG